MLLFCGQKLKANTDEAVALGVCGVPTFQVLAVSCLGRSALFSVVLASGLMRAGSLTMGLASWPT